MSEPVNGSVKQTWKILDKRRFLLAVMREFAGNAHISFEGDLSKTQLSTLPYARTEETAALKRNTLWPKQEFIVLPLEEDSIQGIGSAVGGTIPKSVLHIQIERNGSLEIGLYDRFTPSQIFLGPELNLLFIDQMQELLILRPFTPSK